jgi:hypothetical protein
MLIEPSTHPFVTAIMVYLNGKKVDYAQSVDEEAGIVTVVCVDANGRLLPEPGGTGRFQTSTLKGRVELRIRPDKIPSGETAKSMLETIRAAARRSAGIPEPVQEPAPGECRCGTECQWTPDQYTLAHHPDCPVMNPAKDSPTKVLGFEYLVVPALTTPVVSPLKSKEEYDKEWAELYKKETGQEAPGELMMRAIGNAVSNIEAALKKIEASSPGEVLKKALFPDNYEALRKTIVPATVLEQQRRFEHERGLRWGKGVVVPVETREQESRDCDCGICPLCNGLTSDAVKTAFVGLRKLLEDGPLPIATRSVSVDLATGRGRFVDSEKQREAFERERDRRMEANKCPYSLHSPCGEEPNDLTEDDDDDENATGCQPNGKSLIGIDLEPLLFEWSPFVHKVNIADPIAVKQFIANPAVWEAVSLAIAQDLSKVREIQSRMMAFQLDDLRRMQNEAINGTGADVRDKTPKPE